MGKFRKPSGPAGAGLLPVGTDAPTAARVMGLAALWENSASLRGPQAQAFCCRWGLTRRLRRGSGTCSPKGRSYFSFDGERKVCKRKQAARRYGKKAPIAHFDGGARNVARNGVGQLTHTGGARSCSPFSAVKMRGPFSLRCLSPLFSAAAWVGTKGE